jgi:hypothetical protein
MRSTLDEFVGHLTQFELKCQSCLSKSERKSMTKDLLLEKKQKFKPNESQFLKSLREAEVMMIRPD